jgi:hypothetical protein
MESRFGVEQLADAEGPWDQVFYTLGWQISQVKTTLVTYLTTYPGTNFIMAQKQKMTTDSLM